MAVKPLPITIFNAGISKDTKLGGKGAVRFIKNLNIYDDANSMAPQPQATKVSGSTVTSLPKWIVDASPWNTFRYLTDAAGNLYKIDPSNETWTSIYSGSSNESGQGLAVFDNYLYQAHSYYIGRYGLLSGTPTMNSDFLSDGTTNLDDSQGLTGNTYTTPVAIAETAANKCTFTPTVDPVQNIQVYVSAKGTGDWTITVHDSDDNAIATKTVANASLTNSAYNSFNFGISQGRVITDTDYHFHVTSTVADGTLRCGTASDLSTADFKEFFGILVYDDSYHPMTEFLNFLCIGNERYLAIWDQATYTANKLTFAPGLRVRALSTINEFLAIGCWDGSITQSEKARIYFWDGISSTFNYFKDLPRGALHGMTNFRETLFSIMGNRGLMHLGVEPFTAIQEMPAVARGKYVDISPAAITTFQNRVVIGAPIITDDGSGFQQGVYMFGNENEGEPLALSLMAVASTGVTAASTHKISCVGAFGDSLYFGWENNGTYGVDKLLLSNNAATGGSYESLIIDNSIPSKDKLAKKLVITFESLPSGCSVTPKYKINRETSWNTPVTQSTASTTQAEVNINTRYREIEIGFDFVSDGDYINITSIYFEYDDLETERRDK